MSGDFSKNNPYLGLNEFKNGFHPKIYEYIGEYDLPIIPKKYYKLRSRGELAKIFNKKENKTLNEKEIKKWLKKKKVVI